MAKVKLDKNKNINTTIDLKNNGKEPTKDDPSYESQEGNDKKEPTIHALRIEIDNLKQKVADQEETIDDLVQERDDVYHEMYKLRLTLADAWNISRATDAEKIWEVLRRTREKTETQGEKKSYSAAAKSSDNHLAVDTTRQKNKETNLTICSSTDSADSGIGMHSLTQLIDERIDIVVDAKLKKRRHAICEIDIEPISNQNEMMQLTPVRRNLDQNREQNVIIHGLKEGDICDTKLVEDIFAATATQHEPAHTMRLGEKNNVKTRPLILFMKNKVEKEEFMSKLWMLKNVKTRFKNMSITNDYTLEERNLIKKWVDEANRRNTTGTNEYQWKVRGTPRDGLRLVKIMNHE